MTQNAIKRPRDEKGTPPDFRRETKKNNNRKSIFSDTYREAISPEKRLVIVLVSYPEKSLKEGDLLTRALLDAIDSIPDGQPVPHFEENC